MKKNIKKYLIIGGSILAAAVVIGVGGRAALTHNQKAVKVAPVANMNQGGWYSQSEITNYGTVTTNFNQDIYYDESLTITDVYVQPGDTVKIGDPLIAYDTTLATLELEMKQMQIEGIGLNIQNVQAELNQLRATTPAASAGQKTTSAVHTSDYQIINTAVVQDDTDDSNIPGTPDNPDNPNNPDDPDTPAQPDKPVIGIEFPEELRGKTIYEKITADAVPYNEDADGSEEHPAHFLCAPGTRVEASFMKAVLENRVICVFEVVDDIEDPKWILYSWILDGYNGQIIQPDEPDEPDEPTEPTEPDEPTEPTEPTEPDEPTIPEEPDIVTPAGPTADELKAAIQEKEQKLKELDLDRREAQLELKKLQKKVNNGVIASTVNGTVKTVLDEETAHMEGSPMISVTGEQGFYITGSVAETALDKLEEGMTATVMSWENGMTYEATVTGVGSTPTSGYYSSNENMSYYPFTVVIKGDAELTNGQGVDLTVDGLSNSMSDELYLDQMFVREEGNQYYVYKKGENGRLTKQYVEVGKIIYNTLEILSGLSPDDEIAFPYGKDVKEGAKTESTDTLYEYY